MTVYRSSMELRARLTTQPLASFAELMHVIVVQRGEAAHASFVAVPLAPDVASDMCEPCDAVDHPCHRHLRHGQGVTSSIQTEAGASSSQNETEIRFGCTSQVICSTNSRSGAFSFTRRTPSLKLPDGAAQEDSSTASVAVHSRCWPVTAESLTSFRVRTGLQVLPPPWVASVPAIRIKPASATARRVRRTVEMMTMGRVVFRFMGAPCPVGG